MIPRTGSGGPRVWLYRDQGRIVGYMGSIAVRVKLGDEERQTGWLVDTMVLEEYRNQGVGPRLMVGAHEDQPFSLSLGQTVEMREIQFRLGWKQVVPLQVARLLIRPEKVLQGRLPAPAAWAAGLAFRTSHAARKLVAERSPFNVRSIERFDERHDRLWTRASRDLTCAVVRDASYLNWKYVDQPGQQFLRLEVSDDQGIRGVTGGCSASPTESAVTGVRFSLTLSPRWRKRVAAACYQGSLCSGEWRGRRVDLPTHRRSPHPRAPSLRIPPAAA